MNDLVKNFFSITPKCPNITLMLLGHKFVFKQNIDKIETNYRKVLKKLRHKQKIKVAFYIKENQKWSYQSLYELLANDEHFEPFIIVGRIASFPHFQDLKTYEDNVEFFVRKGFKVYQGWNKKNLNIKKFRPDIVFYDQPWHNPSINHPCEVSNYALTFYCPYGIQTFKYKKNYTRYFHKYLFRYIVEHKLNLKRFKKYKTRYSNNCVVLGYPKMDVYLEKKEIDLSKYWKNPDKFKIIYAPHHSFGEDHTTNIGTFLQNSKFILDLAKNNPDTTWIYKPHPWLRSNIITKNNIMTEQEYDAYVDEWKRIGNVCDDGEYFDIFKSSDLMITDCASFLSEYLPSQKPIIRLVNSEESIKFNLLGKKMLKCIYKTQDNETLLNLFNDIVYNKKDYLCENRISFANEIIDYNESSAHKIYNYILKLLKDN